MTANDYRKLIEALGLSQAAAARLFGVDARTSRKWALGERPISPTAAAFLKYLWATRSTDAFDRLLINSELKK